MADYEIGAGPDDPLAQLGVSGEDWVEGDDDEAGGEDWVSGDDDEAGADEDDGAGAEDDETGAEDDEIGALLRRPSLPNLRRARAKLTKRHRALKSKARTVKKATSVMKNRAQKMRRGRLNDAAKAGMLPQLTLPVDSGVNVLAAATVDIQPQPTRPMRITDFTVSPDIAPSFRINRIEIAGVNLFAGGGAIDASCFVPTVRRPPLQAVLLAAGVPAVINVTNKSGADARFNGMLWGVPVHAI